MTKIYAQGNYIVIEANNKRNTFPKRDVRFKVVDEDGIYSLSSQELPIGDFNYSDVKKEDGSDYTTALEFETFLFENTGNFNSGADGSPNYNDYSVDEIQAGKFIYLNDNGDKVSKPKYRKVIQIDNTDEHITGSSINLADYIANLEKVFPTTTFENNIEGIHGYVNPGFQYSALFNTMINFYDSIMGTNVASVPIAKMTIYAEYTKTTDTETLI